MHTCASKRHLNTVLSHELISIQLVYIDVGLINLLLSCVKPYVDASKVSVLVEILGYTDCESVNASNKTLNNRHRLSCLMITATKIESFASRQKSLSRSSSCSK